MQLFAHKHTFSTFIASTVIKMLSEYVIEVKVRKKTKQRKIVIYFGLINHP